VEEDTWEPRENLGNAKNLVERFKEEYGKKSRQARIENYRELPGRYTAKMLYG